MNETKVYNNNYLSSVICRVDFAEMLPEETIAKIQTNTLLTTAYPIRAKDIIKEDASIIVDEVNAAISKTKEKYVIHNLVDNDGHNKLMISKKNFVFEYKNYISFEKTQQDFMSLINIIIEDCPDFKISRFGLRYINLFDTDSTKINKNYFSNAINGLVNIENLSGMDISRAMGNIEYLSEDIRLIMKYGDFNRSYPGILKKHDFVLDYDASIQGLYKISDAFPQKLVKAHEMIQTAFEESITDKLRQTM